MKNIIIIILYISLFIIGANWVEQPNENNQSNRMGQQPFHVTKQHQNDRLSIEMLSIIQAIETDLTSISLERNQSKKTDYITQVTNDLKQLQRLAHTQHSSALNTYAREYLKVNNQAINLETLTLLSLLEPEKKNISYLLPLLVNTNDNTVKSATLNELKRYSAYNDTILSALLWQLKKEPNGDNQTLYDAIAAFIDERSITTLYEHIGNLNPTSKSTMRLKEIVLEFEMNNT